MKKVSQSQQKLFNYLDVYIESDYFQAQILKLRTELAIPEEGFEISDEILDKLRTGVIVTPFYVPEQFAKSVKSKAKALKLSNKNLKNIIKNFEINNFHILDIFRLYLYHNIKCYELLSINVAEISLCRIEDFKETINELSFLTSEEEISGMLKYNFNDYPIIIKLHPNTTQRDLIDYIKNNWLHIDHYLSEHRNKESQLGRFKTRDRIIKKRNDLIYKNRHLTLKEISKIVSKDYDTIDQGHISKIVSLEKEKRKKV